MKKILTVLGARPQFVKAAVISRLINSKYSDKLQEIIVHTGQHYDKAMSEVFFQEMSIPHPKYLLNTGNKPQGEMTGLMLIELEKIMLKENPDLVVVYGDTNTTLAASINAVKLHIPVVHIEAGMRSGNKRMPEEINRIVSDHIATYLFCTTTEPAENLRQENITNNVHVVGDVMYDAVLYYKNYSKPPVQITNLPENFCLATCHRQENTNDRNRLEQIFSALRFISLNYNKVVLPLHPRTKKYIDQYNISTENIIIIEPLSYLEMIHYLKQTKIVITDSGGLQREAYYFEKPVIILNEQTEWKELLENNVAICSGANSSKILQYYNQLQSLNTKPAFKGIYGDGLAAHKILDILSSLN